MLAMHGTHSFPRRTVPPQQLCVSIEEARDELDIPDDSSFDTRIERLIKSATEAVEHHTQRMLMPQTWQLTLDRFPSGGIELRKLPVVSVEFIKHIVGGVLTTLSVSQYEVDLITEPPRIVPVVSKCWPETDCVLNAVTVEWTAGYSSPSLVPSLAKDAVLYRVCQAFNGCEVGDNYWSMISDLKWGFSLQ